MLTDTIRNLYLNKKYNTREIGEILKMSQWRVISLMKTHDIPRRTSAESNNINFLKKSPSYHKKTILTQSERSLALLGRRL